MAAARIFQSTNLANHNLSRCPCHTSAVVGSDTFRVAPLHCTLSSLTDAKFVKFPDACKYFLLKFRCEGLFRRSINKSSTGAAARRGGWLADHREGRAKPREPRAPDVRSREQCDLSKTKSPAPISEHDAEQN